MSVSTPFRALPKNMEQWLVAAMNARVETTSLLGFRNHRSGSEVTKAQFLTFRTLVISRGIDQFDPASWLDGNTFATATQDVNNSADFGTLLSAIQDPNAPEPTGGFSQIPLMHKQTLNNIDRSFPKKLQVTDESPVNSSLIWLLNAIINIAPNASAWWREPKANHQVWAVVECKSARISPKSPMVMMQEAALFVAWMREFPGYPTQRVLVSQDGLFLFITFAEITPEWRDFLLRNRISGPRSFLTLHRYGPWDLTRADDVMQAAAILLAITR